METKLYQLELNGRNVATVQLDDTGKYHVDYTCLEDVHTFVGVMCAVIADLPNGKAVIAGLPLENRSKLDRTLQ